MNDIVKMYLQENLTIKEISSITNIPYSTLRCKLIKLGVKMKGKSWSKKSMTGDKIGRYEVIKESSRPYKKFAPKYWVCKCECGTIKEVSGTALRAGLTISCGCYHSESLWKGFGDISGSYWARIVRGAKSRNLEIKVNKEFCWSLFIKQNKKCALSGIELCFCRDYTRDSIFQTASLDRIDNTKGYIEGNVQWLHKDINMLKNNLTETRLLELATAIVNNKK